MNLNWLLYTNNWAEKWLFAKYQSQLTIQDE